MKTVIAGLEEGLNAIAEALEGDSIVPTPAAADEGKVLTAGDDGTASWETPEGGIPTPTLDDEGKVLKAVPQTQTTVAPEWGTVNEVPIGGRNGQVLTKNSNGYGWANPTQEIPSVDENYGKFLQAGSIDDDVPVQWSTVNQVPSGGSTGQVLTKTSNGYGWAAASGGGGGNIDVIKISVNKADFTQDGSNYVASVFPPTGISSKIDKLIGITIVDASDAGYPDIITPHNNDECAISYFSGDFTITISSTIYAALGSREPNIFYLTYYTGA